ncbi:hypothetical protein DUNSADRAFT_9461 [Dunaliella salina]|uniref:Uncharacterized protein n=1 Tax=Dunaliella salina TaxID=3046 RepID=A0ABQ7GHE3_DUNSA|nr:hypothetical protein DUNSADRAFT_9461 [Dunaliella salina]|eukprot:KAF5834022.1 hypothetical protein DUNSADRAFT_9461 [Dunaliella salina]
MQALRALAMSPCEPWIAFRSISHEGHESYESISRNPGAAYHAWTYENRQKVLDSYFNRDHQRKMRTLRSQKDKADAAAALEEAIEAREDAAAETRERLWRLAKRAEKDAYEHTGYKPLKLLEVDEVAERINAALDAAVAITRKKSLLDGTGYEGGRGTYAYRPPPDMRSLLDQICSPGWYERMALPANLETLKVALAVRKDALELARLQDASAQAAHLAVQGADMAGHEAKHAMGVQAALLQDALMARTAELERCLLADAYAVASQASTTAQHAAFAAQQQDSRLSGMPAPRQTLSLLQQQQQPLQRLQGPTSRSTAFRPPILSNSTTTALPSASQAMAPSPAVRPSMLPAAASFVQTPHGATMPYPSMYAGETALVGSGQLPSMIDGQI